MNWTQRCMKNIVVPVPGLGKKERLYQGAHLTKKAKSNE